MLKGLLLGIAIACLLSFAAARRRFVGSPNRRLRIMVGIGMAVSLLQLGWLAAHPPTPWFPLSLLGYGGALLVFWWAFSAHPRDSFRLAFSEEGPGQLVVSGPYRIVRHPYYLSYLLFWAAGAIGSGSIWMWGTVGLMYALYRTAADHEERQFEASPLAGEYARYCHRTGRFLPWIGRR